MGEKEMRESKLEDPALVITATRKALSLPRLAYFLATAYCPANGLDPSRLSFNMGKGSSNGADTAAETSSPSSSSSSSCHVDLPTIIVFDLDDCLWCVVFFLRLVFTVFVQSAEVVVPKA